MSDITNVLIKPCDNNESGLLGYVLAAPKSAFDSIASTFREDAVEFSDQVAYAVNDLVNYGCETYECTTIHPAGAWDDAHFTIIPNGGVRINGTHTLTAGKTFTRIELNDEESMSAFESLGKKYNRSGKMTAQFFHPGSSVEASNFNLLAKLNRQWIILVPMASGKIEQLGTDNSFAEIVGSRTSGTRENPDSRWLFEASAYAKTVYYYEGTLPV